MDYSRILCYWYKMNGECTRGNCPYTHSFDEIELCRQWREGTCPFVVDCHNRHYYLEAELNMLKISLCRKWQKGECTIPSDCAFRHHYTEGDDQVEESKRFGCPSKGLAVQFTGPISVKIVKETRELQKELYDLDTGEIRTWTETEEYEVVDLTEDTPVRVARTGSIDLADLRKKAGPERAERYEASFRALSESKKSLDNLSYKLGIRQSPVIKSPKLSNSSSNLSLNINTISSPLKSTSTLLLSQLGKENQDFDESKTSSTIRSSLLLGESPSKRRKLSNSPPDQSHSLNQRSVTQNPKIGGLIRSSRVRANSLRV